jgi:hypothetical protein
MPKKKEEKEKTTQEKLTDGDAVDDQDTKQYEDEETMKALAEDEDTDDEVLGASGEVVEPIKEEKKETKKKEEKKKETKPKEKDEEQSIEEIVDDVTGKEEEPDKPKEKESEETTEKPVEVELSDDVKKALNPYKGELAQQIQQLVQAYNSAQAKLSSLIHLEKVVQELGFQDSKPDVIVTAMKELHSTATDLRQNPELLDIMESIASGKIPEEFIQDKKTPQDFMDDGEMFDTNDAMTVPESASYQAREKWEDHKEQLKRKKVNLQSIIGKRKDSIEKDLDGRYKQAKETLDERLSEVELFAKDEYGVNDEVFGSFKKMLSSFDVEIIKTAFAVYAKQNKIKSKRQLAIEANRDKVSTEADLGEASESGKDLLEKNKDMEEEMSETFNDWDTPDDVVVM